LNEKIANFGNYCNAPHKNAILRAYPPQMKSAVTNERVKTAKTSIVTGKPYKPPVRVIVTKRLYRWLSELL
jgi:hypothetical protein